LDLKKKKRKEEKAKEESEEDTDDDAEQHGQWIDFHCLVSKIASIA
jgi:hypothetical protein